jgi:hypothetical protein
MSQTPPFESESIAANCRQQLQRFRGTHGSSRQTAQRICLMVGSEQLKLFMLGSSNTGLPNDFEASHNRQASILRLNPCSLIAPIMREVDPSRWRKSTR